MSHSPASITICESSGCELRGSVVVSDGTTAAAQPRSAPQFQGALAPAACGIVYVKMPLKCCHQSEHDDEAQTTYASQVQIQHEPHVAMQHNAVRQLRSTNEYDHSHMIGTFEIYAVTSWNFSSTRKVELIK